LAPRSSSTARYTLAVPPVSRSYLMRQVIRGHQRPSEAIRGNQMSSEVIRCCSYLMRQAIRPTHSHSIALHRNPLQSEVISVPQHGVGTVCRQKRAVERAASGSPSRAGIRGPSSGSTGTCPRASGTLARALGTARSAALRPRRPRPRSLDVVGRPTRSGADSTRSRERWQAWRWACWR
jgi:hypothetical protein